MSLYSPNASAAPAGSNFIALLSQRDLSLTVPINYVTVLGVSLTPACFPNQQYEDAQAALCLSNLLAVGYSRIEIDVYWDPSRRSWSLCPIQLGNGTASADGTTASAPSISSTASATLASGQLTNRAFESPVGIESLGRRQTGGSGSIATGSPAVTMSSFPLVTVTTSLSSASPIAGGGSATSGSLAAQPSSTGLLFQSGPYGCTSTVNFGLVTALLSEYLQNTENNLNATIKYLILNVHAAASASQPAQEVPSSSLPHDNELLSALLLTNNSIYMYTPSNLASQRANLDAADGWLSTRTGMPNVAYLQTTNVNGRTTTSDGWPNEEFMELQNARRLLVGYGTVDPQMQAYNFSGDAGYIFPPGYLQTPWNATFSSNSVTSGCIFNPNQDTVASANSSWATFVLDATPDSMAAMQAASLTDCGISPILNETLNSTSAAENFMPYQAWARSTLWTWAESQPRNTANSTNERCATLNATLGRFQVSDCTQTYYGACRVPSQPYQWQISSARSRYDSVKSSCPDNTTFGVPNTALEKAYLLTTWRGYLSAHVSQPTPTSGQELLWLNFNDLDVPNCWVVGQNTTCPYSAPTDMDADRQTIVVPTVAAVIVFVLALLTIFVKCASNRRTSKRRRKRGDDGWDYEGVPS